VHIWGGVRCCLLCARPGGGDGFGREMSELAVMGDAFQWKEYAREGNGRG
jgi:hypothetical protein